MENAVAKTTLKGCKEKVEWRTMEFLNEQFYVLFTKLHNVLKEGVESMRGWAGGASEERNNDSLH